VSLSSGTISNAAGPSIGHGASTRKSFEICINFEGCGTIHEHPATTTVVNPQRVAHYVADESRLKADRHAGQRHRFLTVEMSRQWLSDAVRGHETVLNREAQGFLRNLRLERAAELLRSGRSNVTEAAIAVGYSSLSHFSKAFAEMFGVCRCVFPLNRRTNR
jgi:AraC-like DNA-binding protein